jgi:hypothetical protein
MLSSRTIVPSILLLLAASTYSFVVPSAGTKRAAFVAHQPSPLFLSDVSIVEEAAPVVSTRKAAGLTVR